MNRLGQKLRQRRDDWRTFSGLGGYLKSRYNRFLRRHRSWPLPGRGRLVRIRHRDLPGDVLVRLGTSDFPILKDLLARGEYDRAIAAAAHQAGGTHAVRLVVDLGANVGIATRLFAREFPQATIVAVEPDDSNLALLERNIAAAPGELRARSIRACAAGHSRPVRLDRSGEPWAYSMTDAGSAPDLVPALTVPRILEQSGSAPDATIDLLKCDIEGAEREVFETCGEWIRRVRVLVVELHAPYSLDEFAAHLRAGLGPGRAVHLETLRRNDAICVVMARLDEDGAP